MKPIDSVRIVNDFWTAVWKAQNPQAIDRFVVDDFILTAGAGSDGTAILADRNAPWMRG